ncbi:diacylglycerol kinase family protein [Alkalilimnicola ehrlichii]|uniref:diacylglycerol/lipid kinase family protein n=1 Tax=Alkalilimnicola ehrlichii TaxID=351052 RepID=UPI002162418C|nr:hypothetical protein [Alkalilimnicola ehrlichii]
MGLVPVGSGSDTARGLRLVAKPKAALERALGVAPRPVDVMRLTQGEATRWVVNIASVGVSGMVAAEVNKLDRRWAGTYLWTALKSLARYRPGQVRVFLDGELWYEGGVVLMAIANGTVFARGMRIAPHALADDGLADVVLVQDVPVRQILPYVPRLYNGGHLKAPFVRWQRAARVRVEPVGELPPFELDGELTDPQTAEYEVISGALQVVY